MCISFGAAEGSLAPRFIHSMRHFEHCTTSPLDEVVQVPYIVDTTVELRARALVGDADKERALAAVAWRRERNSTVDLLKVAEGNVQHTSVP